MSHSFNDENILSFRLEVMQAKFMVILSFGKPVTGVMTMAVGNKYLVETRVQQLWVQGRHWPICKCHHQNGKPLGNDLR